MVKVKLEDEVHTYGEWQKLGYQVIAGERSKQRDAKGQAVFTYNQVVDVESDEEDLRDAVDGINIE